MRPAWKYSLVPVLAGAAALVAVLPQRGGDATVRIVYRAGGFAYEPSQAQIAPGQRVAFRNQTRRTHTATCDACPWDTGDIQPGQVRFVTFRDQARNTFACRYHPDQQLLHGTVTVGAPPPPPPSPSPSEPPHA